MDEGDLPSFRRPTVYRYGTWAPSDRVVSGSYLQTTFLSKVHEDSTKLEFRSSLTV